MIAFAFKPLSPPQHYNYHLAGLFFTQKKKRFVEDISIDGMQINSHKVETAIWIRLDPV